MVAANNGPSSVYTDGLSVDRGEERTVIMMDSGGQRQSELVSRPWLMVSGGSCTSRQVDWWKYK